MSIATLRIKRPPPCPAAGASSAFLDGLRGLQRDCGPNRNDQAVALITACIEEGWSTRARIVGALKALGFDGRHAAIMLNDNAGSDPAGHRWQRDQTGVYRLHNDPA